jgi:2-polyprenyl-3-methyl-5-hydroxy-6-metoxy-1,4-benzoquinol methylase
MTAPDYDELYRDAATNNPPWEIGRVQPALAAVLGEAKGPKVLDAGCGTGSLAIALARRGYQVTAFDVSRVAIDAARKKAAAEGLSVDFQVQDATGLSFPEAPFDSVFDCGLLHNLYRHGGAAEYLAALPDLAAPGATVFVEAISAAAGYDWKLTEEILRATFAGPQWTNTRIDEAEIDAQVDGEQLSLPGLLLRTIRAAA